eukprot:SAG31_NODE_12440_length_942_cov_1.345196_1_plen_215_part_00
MCAHTGSCMHTYVASPEAASHTLLRKINARHVAVTPYILIQFGESSHGYGGHEPSGHNSLASSCFFALCRSCFLSSRATRSAFIVSSSFGYNHMMVSKLMINGSPIPITAAAHLIENNTERTISILCVYLSSRKDLQLKFDSQLNSKTAHRGISNPKAFTMELDDTEQRLKAKQLQSAMSDDPDLRPRRLPGTPGSTHFNLAGVHGRTYLNLAS